MGSPFLITHSFDHNRIQFLDVLRGVALFGILMVNVFSFGADIPAWKAKPDQTIWLLKHLIFETKFWMLFSVLFGMGFYLQAQSSAYHITQSIRRLSILMIFGCLHALLFEGDILMLYAQLGVLLLVLYRLPPRLMLLVGLLLCSTFPLGHLLGGDRGDELPPEGAIEAAQWLEEERRESFLVAGSFADVVTEHAGFIPEWFWIDWQYPDSGWLVLACFLFGVAIMRDGWGYLQRLTPAQLTRITAICWCAGLLLMVLERYWAATIGYRPFDRTDASPGRILLADVTYLSASVCLASAWFFSVYWWVLSEVSTGLKARIACVGKMSLTNYLGQTLIFTFVFYGYGMGVAFLWGPAQVACLAVVIYLTQLIVSHWWCARFVRGPCEWVWRSLTYWRWEPMKKRR